jgi:hypothetical protein
MLSLTVSITGKQPADVQGELDSVKERLAKGILSESASISTASYSFALTGVSESDPVDPPPFPMMTTFVAGDRVQSSYDPDFTGSVVSRTREYWYFVLWDGGDTILLRRDYIKALDQ